MGEELFRRVFPEGIGTSITAAQRRELSLWVQDGAPLFRITAFGDWLLRKFTSFDKSERFRLSVIKSCSPFYDVGVFCELWEEHFLPTWPIGALAA